MNLGMPEMIFIFLMALMVFGPRKLPELARSLGKAMAEFKRASNEFKYQLESEINAMDVQENQVKRPDFAGTILPARARNRKHAADGISDGACS